jgi:hypothetical protein
LSFKSEKYPITTSNFILRWIMGGVLPLVAFCYLGLLNNNQQQATSLTKQKDRIPIIKAKRCTNFSNLFLE